MKPSARLSRKQETAISCLLEQPTIKEAAVFCGVGEVTLWRWMQQPDFQECYRAAKRQVVEQSITRLLQVTGEAVSTLREIMLDKEAPTSSRVSAAKTILETAIKSVEIEDILTRLEALEQAQADKEQCR
ncbi:MAG: hypothetical protein ABSA82_00345 [Thermacetogeniaceae bacterium]